MLKKPNPSVGPSHVSSGLFLAGCMILYMGSGPCAMLTNSRLINQVFNYPVMVSSIGIFSVWILSAVMLATGHAPVKRPDLLWNFHQTLTCDLPVGVCAAISYASGTAAYRHLNVSTIQVMKSFTPVITQLVTVGLGLEDVPPAREICLLFVICITTSLTSFGGAALAQTGVLLMLTSCFAESGKVALQQKLLHRAGYSLMESIFHINMSILACMALYSLVFEVPRLAQELGNESALTGDPARDLMASHSDLPTDDVSLGTRVLQHPHLFLLSGFFGVMCIISEMLFLKVFSGTYVKLAATARAALFIIVTVAIFGEGMSAFQMVGSGTTLAAFALYHHSKRQAQAAQAQKTETPKTQTRNHHQGGPNAEGGGNEVQGKAHVDLQMSPVNVNASQASSSPAQTHPRPLPIPLRIRTMRE